MPSDSAASSLLQERLSQPWSTFVPTHPPPPRIMRPNSWPRRCVQQGASRQGPRPNPSAPALHLCTVGVLHAPHHAPQVAPHAQRTAPNPLLICQFVHTARPLAPPLLIQGWLHLRPHSTRSISKLHIALPAPLTPQCRSKSGPSPACPAHCPLLR